MTVPLAPSLLAVRDFIATSVRSQGDAISAQTIWLGIDVFRYVPRLEKLGTRTALVIGPVTDSLETRMTVPRQFGTKRRTMAFPLMLHAVHKDPETGSESFDRLLDLVSAGLRRANVPITWPDPLTGVATYVLQIGEQIALKASEPYRLSDGPAGLIHFFADGHCSAVEEFQG
jgi:hypothetical protein